MSTLGYVLVFSTASSVISLIGGLLLLSREKFAYTFSRLLAPFAAGTLLGTAFLDLLPESYEMAEGRWDIFFWTLVGILFFFMLERFVRWFHHHHQHEHDEEGKGSATVPLIVFGDTVHNFIDGVVIAGTFLVSIPVGIVSSIAIAAHEIPQEIGDFGILLNQGVPRAKVLLYNVLSAGATLVGALLTYFIGQAVIGLLPLFLSITAGFFIYIAASDIIPEIHNTRRKGFAMIDGGLLLAGVSVIWLTVTLLHKH
jgi:zinc and cadmium transporter